MATSGQQSEKTLEKRYIPIINAESTPRISMSCKMNITPLRHKSQKVLPVRKSSINIFVALQILRERKKQIGDEKWNT